MYDNILMLVYGGEKMIDNKTDPKTKAKRKYNEKSYKRVSLYLKNEEMSIIEDFCKNKNYSKNNLFVESVREKIEKETGKNFDDLMSEMRTAGEVGSAETAEDPDTESGEE